MALNYNGIVSFGSYAGAGPSSTLLAGLFSSWGLMGSAPEVEDIGGFGWMYLEMSLLM